MRATLNAPVGEASLSLCAKVFQTGLLEHAGNADIGWARVPLQALVTAHPSENVLDACMLQEQQRRQRAYDARDYHTRALPNAIRAAARDLTTRDPAIVPLDDGVPEWCPRNLGET